MIKSKVLKAFLVLCILIGCVGLVNIAKFVYEFNEKDYYIFEDSIVVNEYIEKIVRALNTNDRELLASLFPEHAYRLDVDAIVRVRQTCHLPVIANITRLWHNDMPQHILYRLAQAAGVNGIVGSGVD